MEQERKPPTASVIVQIRLAGLDLRMARVFR